MSEAYDTDGTNGTVTLSAGESRTFTVDSTNREGDVVVFVDNGATGTAAATYDLVVNVIHEGGTTQQFGSDSGITSLSLTDPAVPPTMEYTLTNASGASADYRVTVVSYR